MADDLTSKLEVTLRDFDDKRRSSKNITRHCFETLEKYIRPALRQTREALSLNENLRDRSWDDRRHNRQVLAVGPRA